MAYSLPLKEISSTISYSFELLIYIINNATFNRLMTPQGVFLLSTIVETNPCPKQIS